MERNPIVDDWELKEEYARIEADAQAEAQAQDPVYQRLERVNFLSTSKGRGRKRSKSVEVNLIKDKWSGVCIDYEHYQFDVYATEILPHVAKDEAVRELRRKLDV